MYLSTNIKFLRKRKRLSQTDLAEALNTKRSSISNYELGSATPPVDVLIGLSDLFNLSIDTMVRVNIVGLRESQIHLIEHGSDVFVKGNELRVLATTVDSNNKENIELVSIKAKAGYTTGYFDPEYISQLPVFNLPFLDRDKKYRTFQISGDSMFPFQENCWVVGEFIQDIGSVKDDQLYIILTLNEGIVFKKVRNELQKNGGFKMISLNQDYAPYDLSITEIREVWKYVLYITNEVLEPVNNSLIMKNLDEIKRGIGDIKNRIEK